MDPLSLLHGPGQLPEAPREQHLGTRALWYAALADPLLVSQSSSLLWLSRDQRLSCFSEMARTRSQKYPNKTGVVTAAVLVASWPCGS